MLTVRRAHDRGHADHGWLQTHHTFSFASYWDPDQMGFRALRVINEDVVAPGGGFPTHPHRDMEILTYVVSGALEHADSMGTGSVIRPGELQRMSAGSGVTHSEYNHSQTEPVHLLQIWILPAEKGLDPGYEQKAFSEECRRNCLAPVASPRGDDGALTIHQDARVYASSLDPGQRVEHDLLEGRHAWIQVVRGQLNVNGERLSAGDGVGLSEEAKASLEAGAEEVELLLFDLA